jgi:hypothetical protein
MKKMYEDQKQMFKNMAIAEAKARKAHIINVLNQVNQMVINGEISFEQLQELSTVAYEKEQKEDVRTSDE